jgi:hypothetical protein
MIELSRRLAFAGVIAAIVAACGKSEPPPKPVTPPPQKVEAPAASAVNADTKRLAGEVYVYAYPLVLMDVMQQVQTAKTPINTFHHTRAFPEASSTETANPNPDMLYSTAWLDLTKEPMVLSLPETKGRYYVFPMLDGWTNVFSSVGKRTTGTGKENFAIIGPAFKGSLPGDVSEIKSPTDMVLLIGRTQTNGKGDYAAVAKLQDQYKLVPLSQWTKKGGGGARAGASAGADLKTPPVDQVAQMDARAFFTRFAKLLPENPPAKADAPMVDKIKKLGIVAGQPFAVGDPAIAAAVEEGVKTANGAIVTATKGSLGDLKNGWTIHWDLGRYGANYGLRAVIAFLGLGTQAPEDAIFASTRLDGGGKVLSGTNKYVLHFDKGRTPPVDGFWSLAMYDEQRHFVANPLDRHAIGDRDKPKLNADGSLDLYLQNENPGKDKESNWLPAPKGNFNVILRMYWPKQELIDTRYAPPAIRQAA